MSVVYDDYDDGVREYPGIYARNTTSWKWPRRGGCAKGKGGRERGRNSPRWCTRARVCSACVRVQSTEWMCVCVCVCLHVLGQQVAAEA